ncbi:MAG: 23S rRNA (cytidine1920-2'-O)/16S rRNA (cytidine1409-2'-O)-methyltransferase [Cognaticolwellia sp.]|jgi:23S rRNA (cytidine1920-2'-O)/16S rRNA (cytidine1409-2'-O)-methyltransferase
MAKAPKRRLDQLVLARGLVPSRQQAQGLIVAGRVLVDDAPVTKCGAQIREDVSLRIKGELMPFVSRGGLKLRGALQAFESVHVAGRICADLGASTGGFTDCLLQRDAAKIYAIDVGYGQMAWSIREDPRVVVMERTNARTLESLPEPIQVVVGDLSFIGLGKILPAITRITAPQADCVLLIKPQFEVGPAGLAKGGVVKSEALREQAVADVLQSAKTLGFEYLGRIESPIQGAKSGNIEYLVHLRAP